MMIRIESQNIDITTAAPRSPNIVKVVICDVDSKGDHEAMARRKKYRRYSDRVCTLDFLQQLMN